MANWDKLDNELEQVLDKMTDKDWELWQTSRTEKKKFRRMQQEIDALLHFSKISMQSDSNSVKINTVENDLYISIDVSNSINDSIMENIGTNNYAMAA